MSARGCSICDDAYGTRWVCPTCAGDPANSGWVEGRADELECASVEGGKPWMPPPKFEAIARAVARRPDATLAEIARETGASVRRVREVLGDIKSWLTK